jgi:hypothetical protein
MFPGLADEYLFHTQLEQHTTQVEQHRQALLRDGRRGSARADAAPLPQRTLTSWLRSRLPRRQIAPTATKEALERRPEPVAAPSSARVTRYVLLDGVVQRSAPPATCPAAAAARHSRAVEHLQR